MGSSSEKKKHEPEFFLFFFCFNRNWEQTWAIFAVSRFFSVNLFLKRIHCNLLTMNFKLWLRILRSNWFDSNVVVFFREKNKTCNNSNFPQNKKKNHCNCWCQLVCRDLILWIAKRAKRSERKMCNCNIYFIPKWKINTDLIYNWWHIQMPNGFNNKKIKQIW